MGLFGRSAPLQDRLALVHPHVVGDVAGVGRLRHRRGPVGVMRVGALQLLARVEVLALVFLVLVQGLFRPAREAGEVVVVQSVESRDR